MSIQKLYYGKRAFSGSARRFASSHANSDDSITHYERLGLAPSASIREIKTQFKKLSKKLHPDLNAHLSSEEKEANNAKFVKIVSAYDTLKDVKRKKQYDLDLRMSGTVPSSVHSQRRSAASEWHNKYYGEAKYYSRSASRSDSTSYTSSGLNNSRHRVHYGPDWVDDSGQKFSGRHVNYGNRYDVPHFDYNQHLLRNLKFEQRIITRNISDDQRDQILQQLSQSGEKLSEELITKHLMRHVNRNGGNVNESTASSSQETQQPFNYRQHMYQGGSNYRDDNDEGSALFKTFMVLGGAGSSLYMLYSIFS